MVRVSYFTLRTVTQQLLLQAPPYYHTTRESSKCYNMLAVTKHPHNDPSENDIIVIKQQIIKI